MTHKICETGSVPMEIYGGTTCDRCGKTVYGAFRASEGIEGKYRFLRRKGWHIPKEGPKYCEHCSLTEAEQ